MKKGQGISINMVIIAAIALIVLIVAAIIVMKGGKNVDQNAGGSSCLSNAGTCRSIVTGCNTDEQPVQATCQDGYQCCQYKFS